MRYIQSISRGGILSKKTIYSSFGLRLLSLLLLLCSLLLNLPIRTNATATYYQNNEMWLIGTLTYVGSSNGYDPVDNLNGETHKIYLNGESERCLAIEPYLTNMCTQSVEGWIDSGYEVNIPYSQRLNVTQSLYTASGTRSGTAYYDVKVEDIQTNLLYRPQRNDTYITLFISGLLLLSCWSLIKAVRHD